MLDSHFSFQHTEKTKFGFWAPSKTSIKNFFCTRCQENHLFRKICGIMNDPSAERIETHGYPGEILLFISMQNFDNIHWAVHELGAAIPDS